MADGVSVVAKDSNNPAWWLGIGGELTTFDPLRLAFDFAYGKADWGKAANGQDLTRQAGCFPVLPSTSSTT